MSTDASIDQKLAGLRALHEAYRIPVTDTAIQAPAAALHSLRSATERAPQSYRAYLDEAVDCYEVGAYRGAVLLVWAAAIEHLYSAISIRRGGLKSMQEANFARFNESRTYRPIAKSGDLLYIGEKNLLLLCEDAGLFNRNARLILEERLRLRNQCGHPTGYVVGREEAVVFIESIINNIIGGAMINWK